MSDTIYDVKDLVGLEMTFRNAAGNAADPTTITFKLEKPDGTNITYVYGTNVELVKIGTGHYSVDFPITQWGTHKYKYIGTGTIQQAEEDRFYVRKPLIA